MATDSNDYLNQSDILTFEGFKRRMRTRKRKVSYVYINLPVQKDVPMNPDKDIAITER